MNKHRHVSEKVKNIVIMLLLISAVFLGWQSQLFGNSSVKLSVLTYLVDDGASSAGSGAQDPGSKEIGEARPVGIAVTNSAGAHYGARYDMDEIRRLYNDTVLIFGRALGSAQTRVIINEKDFRASLLAPGVYYEYASPMRLSVLDDWFGTQIDEDWKSLLTRRLCLAAVDGALSLYFQDADTGLFYAAGTAVSPESITKLNDVYGTNNTSFAFESLKQDLKDPYTLMMPDAAHPVIEAVNPLTGDKLTEVLRTLGVSEHRKPIQLENGVQAYPEEEFRIELSPDGTVSYKRTNAQAVTPAPIDESRAVELARLAVSTHMGNAGGEARIYFDTVRKVGENKYQVTFFYVAAGGRVYLNGDGYAASVTIEGDVIDKMALRFRSYTAGADSGGLMPEIQTAAAAGGAYMLYYQDNGGDMIEPAWVPAPDFQDDGRMG